jgi:hypothetical protein
MTEEKEDPNARDKFIIGQYPNEFEFECAFKKIFTDEIEIDDRYSYENTFGNLDETNQIILNGNDSLPKGYENNINDFNNINTTNYLNDIDKSFDFWAPNNPENNDKFNQSDVNFILFNEIKTDVTSEYSKKKQIFMNIGPNIGKKRKFMKDMIRKRIKSDFYRVIRKNLNSKINSEVINLKKSFDFPQTMITNVSKNHCKKNLNMTLKEILEFYYKTDNQEINSINLMILENNKSIILLLENKKIYELENIFSIKIVDLYNEYSKSNQFQESISELIKEGNCLDYIKKYIEVAEELVNYYQKSSCEEEY